MIFFLAEWLIYPLALAAAVLLVLQITHFPAELSRASGKFFPAAKQTFKAWRKWDWRRAVIILLAAVFALSIGKLLQQFPIESARPYQIAGYLESPYGVEHSADQPFPSDHAVFAFTLALAVIFATSYRRLGIILFCVGVLVCVGRYVAMVHSVWDLLGGLACALLGSLWYFILRSKHFRTA